jgi:hypothetical protein
VSKREKAIAICKQALHELESELAIKEGGVANRDLLLLFKKHLEKIVQQLEGNQLPPRNERLFGMGHAIVDSWSSWASSPRASSLGELLCSAEQAYRDV